MLEFLVIRLLHNSSAEWILVDSAGSQLSAPAKGALTEAAVAAGNRPVIVLVPATDVLLSSVHIPSRSHSKIRNALPFALEENLADDIENLHFAIGARKGNEPLPVAVVSNEKMLSWLRDLNIAGIEPFIVTAENHGLSKIPGTMSLLIDGKTVLFNDGRNVDIALQNMKPSEALVAAGHLGESDEEIEGISRHLFVFCLASENEELSHEWLALRNELNSVDVNILPDGVLPKLAVTVAAGHGINLLQGTYGKKTEYSSMLRPWKTTAILLLGLAIVGLMSKAVTYNELSQYKTELKTQFVNEYRQIRPNDEREIIDPVATVNSLRQGNNTSQKPQIFLPILHVLGTSIATHPDVKIEVISYRAEVINLRLTVPDITTLDSIRKAIITSGQFKASIQSTDQIADKINSRMQIKAIES